MERITTIQSWKNHINMINEQYNETDKTLKIEYNTDQDIFDIGQKLKHNNIEHAWSAEIGTLIFNNKEDKEKAEKLLNENLEKVSNKHEITLIENREGGEKIDLVVDEKTYEKLTDINFIGGFKRFDIDLYDDKSDKALNYDGLEDFLSKVFITSIENVKKILNENVGVSVDFTENEINKIKDIIPNITKDESGLYCFLDYCLIKHSTGIDLLKKNTETKEFEDFKNYNSIDEFISDFTHL